MGFFKKKINLEILGFLIAGGLTALIYAGLLALGIQSYIVDCPITVSLAYFVGVSAFILVKISVISSFFNKVDVNKIISLEFLVYSVVGGLTALIYFGLIALGVEVLALEYRITVSVAYIVAVSFHFFANRKFTFRVEDNRVIRQSIRYLGVLIINYLITIAIVSFLVAKHGVSTYLSAAVSIVVTVFIGYLASKLWVFRVKESLGE